MKKRNQWAAAAAVIALAIAAPAFVVTNTIYAAYPDDAKYVGNEKCKTCHNVKAAGEQWNAWKKMEHAKAFETLKGDAAKKIATDKGLAKPAHESPECLKCHVTAYDAEKASAPETIKPEDGVQCESCHGPASIHLEEGKQVKFQKAEIDLSVHQLKIDSKLCEKCHNPESPTWDPEKYTTEDGKKVGFDFEQAKKKIAHDNPQTKDE